mgnify:FL=1
MKPDQTPDVPAGFQAVEQPPGFTRHNGPFYEKTDAHGQVRAFRVLERHLNRNGVVHGGMLAAFMDNVLAHAVHRSAGHPAYTVRMVTDFLHPARPGDWIEGRARVIRHTRTLAFVEGELSVGSRRVLAGTGVFRLDQRQRG